MRSFRVVVNDRSMTPLLEPGDRLLVDPATGQGVPPVPGQIVVAADPTMRGRWLVKRVDSVSGDLVQLRADNATTGTDSRQFGPISLGDLRGVVWYRYYPARRRGPI